MPIPPGQQKNTDGPQIQDYPFERVVDADILTDISDKRFVQEYANPGRPAIIRGGLQEMPAARWTPELMVQRWGDKSLPLKVRKGGYPISFRHCWRQRLRIRLLIYVALTSKPTFQRLSRI